MKMVFSEEYPPIIGISPHVCANPIALCPKTRYICSVQITPACGRLFDSIRTGGPGRRILATDYGFTENIGNLGKSRQLLNQKHGIFTEYMLPGGTDFYPLLLKVGKDIIKGEIGGKSITDMACKGADF